MGRSTWGTLIHSQLGIIAPSMQEIGRGRGNGPIPRFDVWMVETEIVLVHAATQSG